MKPNAHRNRLMTRKTRARALGQQIGDDLRLPGNLVEGVVNGAAIAWLVLPLGHDGFSFHVHLALLVDARLARFRGIQELAAALEIIDVGRRVVFGLSHLVGALRGEFGDLRIRILHVAEHAALRGTDHHAGGLQAHFEAVRAEIAFLRRHRVGVDEELIIRTGRDAGFTPDAPIRVQVHDSVAASEKRLRRANVLTGRIVALIAQDGQKFPSGAREGAFFNLFHPASPDADGNIVFRFTRDCASMTSDAGFEVDRHCILGHEESSLLMKHVSRNVALIVHY